MKKVSFKQMKDGTKEDYLLLDKHEKKFVEKTPDRILKYMSELTSTLEGYQVSRLEHSLQSATKMKEINIRVINIIKIQLIFVKIGTKNHLIPILNH